MSEFSHLDDEGKARMVDVSAKSVQVRIARAAGEIHCSPRTIQLLKDRELPKGDVLAVAKIAGIQATKLTAQLIPLCHSLPLDWVNLEFTFEEAKVRVISEVRCAARTGVEMEALTSVSVAALTIYDMCKAVDKQMVISDIRLLEKIKQ